MTESPRELTDPAALKAFTHPLRQRILRELHRNGPATATTLAAALGQNTGATSYHLRQLARHDFIREDPELGHGKQRWWRPTAKDIRFPRAAGQPPEVQALLAKLADEGLAADLATYARFAERRAEFGEWRDAVPYSRGALTLTQEELGRFFADYLDLLNRYREQHDPDAPDSRRLLVRWVAFPDPGDG
ncbi:helix-turn-helix domain-containing protein [Crossiella sp. SN42]|uniref:winged helix-turn-helix domain-containing protein n=1 Tax=Crossiella sp. SN42 TaxID=2944808 RepID=UPI00207CDFB8|nr:helix-turn-helix domain-containing protein [Crossiella sp. SN42]MCO1576168.1 helix-turn-helix domain-containing protein [Crossiella sp. SN42]